jgi:PAS domain S-box-containing protein
MPREDKPMRVLLIEDNPVDTHLVRRLLAEVENAHLDLECADRLSTGLECLDRGGVDVVLLDLVLPDSQGLNTFVKAHAHAPEVPIVVLTHLDDEALAIQAMQEGAQDYLFKWEFDGQLMARAMKYAIERKRASVEFKELLGKIERAKQEWESTADSLSELICLVDVRGRIIRTNRTVETWNLGRVVDVKGREFHELLHPGCTDSSCYLDSFWKQAWEKALRGQSAQYEADDAVLERYVLVQVQPWKDSGKGKPDSSIVVVVQDITERKRAEEALREYSERLEEMVDERTKELCEAQERLLRAERLAVIGQLGASVGHELRNPLGIIKNSAYYINMKLSDADEKVKKHLKIIESEISRSNKIISDLMSFAQGKKPVLQKAQINAIVQDALWRTPVPDTVAVIIKLGGDLPPLMADPSQIEQVFINMISNAVQAMTSPNSVDTGGRLEISTRVEDGFIVTEFKDNGCGISEENLGKLFEPLFTTKTKGIGLGLAVSKRIVEAHEGSIEVESEAGKGTVFVIKLPASVKGAKLHHDC